MKIAVVLVLLAAPGCSLMGLYDAAPFSGDAGAGCPEPFQVCGEDCVDLDNDSEHCGGCDVECRADQICDGECVCRPGLRDCGDGSGCVDLRSSRQHCGECDAPCEGFCDEGECTENCSKESCLDGSCVDVMTDPLHCGNCGTPCATDQLCLRGVCSDYRPALSEDCATARCDDDETCCSAYTTEVCVTGDVDANDCPE